MAAEGLVYFPGRRWNEGKGYSRKVCPVDAKRLSAKEMLGLQIKVWLPIYDPKRHNELIATVIDFAPHEAIEGVNKFLLYGKVICDRKELKKLEITVHKQGFFKAKEENDLRVLQIVCLADGEQDTASCNRSGAKLTVTLRQWEQAKCQLLDSFSTEPHEELLDGFLFKVSSGRLAQEEIDSYRVKGHTEPYKVWPDEVQWYSDRLTAPLVLHYNGCTCDQLQPAAVYTEHLRSSYTELQSSPVTTAMAVDEFLYYPVNDAQLAEYHHDLHTMLQASGLHFTKGLIMKNDETNSSMKKCRVWTAPYPPNKEDMTRSAALLPKLSVREFYRLLNWEDEQLKTALPVDWPYFDVQLFERNRSTEVVPFRPLPNLDTKEMTWSSCNRALSDIESSRDLSRKEINDWWCELMKEMTDPKVTHPNSDTKEKLCKFRSQVRKHHLVPCKNKNDTVPSITWTPVHQVPHNDKPDLMWSIIGVIGQGARSTYSLPAHKVRKTLGNMWSGSHALPFIRAQLRESMHRLPPTHPKVVCVFHMFSGLGVLHILKLAMHDLEMHTKYAVMLINIEYEKHLREAVSEYSQLPEQITAFPCGIALFQFKDVKAPGMCCDTSLIQDAFMAHIGKKRKQHQAFALLPELLTRESAVCSEHQKAIREEMWWQWPGNKLHRFTDGFGIDPKHVIHLFSVPCNNVSSNNHGNRDVNGSKTCLRGQMLHWWQAINEHCAASR